MTHPRRMPTGRTASASDSEPTQAAGRATAPWPHYEDALRHCFPDKDALLAEARALSAAHRQARRRRTQGTALGVLALAIAGTWWVDPAWRSETLRTAVGERSVWTLRDGSRIDLNTHTTLVVESRLRSRTFRLESGEAMFTVAHAWRPFVVHTPHSAVRDIGTVFNVRVQPGQDDVTVSEGAVDVTARGRSDARRVVANQTLRVNPDGAASATASMALRTVNAGEVVAWQQGRLIFRETPLAQVAEQIERYRPYRLRIADARVGQWRLTGAYDIAGLDQLLRDLPHIVPVKVVAEGQGYLIQPAGR